jgi:Short C-terminal domain
MWRDLKDAHIKEGMRGATITMKTMDGSKISVDDLPKAQARRIYTLAQGMEEQLYQARMERELVEKRAGAGGIVMNVPTAPQAVPQPALKEDPMEQLAKLKKMLDAGLITEDEYNTKKAEILSRM